MQPQQSSSNPDFDFITEEPVPPKRSGLANTSRPVKILITTVVVLLIVIVGGLMFGRGGSNAPLVVDVVAQSQEIVRVSQLEGLQFNDLGTQALVATTAVTIQSQKQQIADYLSRARVKFSQSDLARRTDSKIDEQLRSSAQNNTLDAAYAAYLRTALTKYQNSLEAAFNASQSRTLQEILQAAFESTETLLKAPQLATRS